MKRKAFVLVVLVLIGLVNTSVHAQGPGPVLIVPQEQCWLWYSLDNSTYYWLEAQAQGILVSSNGPDLQYTYTCRGQLPEQIAPPSILWQADAQCNVGLGTLGSGQIQVTPSGRVLFVCHLNVGHTP